MAKKDKNEDEKLDEVKNSVNKILSAKKAKAISIDKNKKVEHLGEVNFTKPDGKRVQNFSGKKLRMDFIYYSTNGKKIILKKGTPWEEISTDIRYNITWKEKNFN